ncbi:type I polyketide synthase [Spongiactinospora sp. TRM90649]|uniref:type I polyketide synthase n=1 Tax=Spongiactinospora sp. TRM90649 TaxID=3031114 RepID=UPI0023F90BB9|nr:type I polyketide synthase [Spongiactinospora sp. TRM90649]MDF5752446.1 type I polyketide synthase [Spongiactinospora sp. TRM90649]
MTDQRALLEQALRQLRDTRARLAGAERALREPITVLGAGVRLPGDPAGGEDVTDLDAYWSLLRGGVDAVTPMTDRPDGHRPPPGDRPHDGHWAGLLREVDRFDAGFWGISSGEADRMDPQQRLTLEVAWEAIEDAGLPLPLLQRRGTGVFLGVYGSDYLSMQFADPGSITAYTAPGGAHSILANRLSYLLDLDGPSMAVDTACSSSLMAVHLAVRALRQGECDIALAGGVNLVLSPLSTLVTGKVLPIAPGGRCRSFDAAADGIVRAEGCGVLVLTRESLATELAPGRRGRGVIRGTAANHDGRTNGLTAPNPRAQAALLRRALDDAGAKPGEVTYVEAHGTGTPLGDPIEMEALDEVYGEGDLPCEVGSVKSNFGHQEAAAGIAGLIKALLVVEHREVPPNPLLRKPNPEIDLTASRLRLATGRPAPLPDSEGPPLAAVSSFGFGGANVHVIVEAATEPATTGAESATTTVGGEPATAPISVGGEPGSGGSGRLVLPLSARGGPALQAMTRAYADLLEGADAAQVSRVAAAAATRRSHLSHRLCVTAAEPSELVRRLREARTAGARPVPPRPPRVAFVFGGQGSQWTGMGAELLAREPVARAEIEACDAVVRDLAGWSVLEQLTAEDDRLHETEVAQVCIASVQLALDALWRSWGVRPHAVAGHSMGEITAARAAGTLTREQALELLLRRARLTERGARGGAMCSVGLPRERVEELIGDDPAIGIGAVNGPESTVVSGERASVDRVAEAAERLGARTRRLPVGYGFHSPLLDGSDDLLAAEVGHITAARGDVPLVSTVTGRRIAGHELDGGHWGRNLREAVLFAPAVEALAATGATVFVELGPHPVLLRDIGETLERAGVRHVAAGGPRRDRPLAESLDRALGDVWQAGVEVTWEGVLGAPAGEVPLPSYPWRHARHWLPSVRTPDLTERPATETAPSSASTSGESAVPLPDEGERVEALALYVRQRIAAALNAADVDEVPADRPLRDFSLDSLVIVELKNQVEGELGITVPLQVLLGALTGGTALDLATAIAAAESGRVEPAAGERIRTAVAGG